MTGDIEPFNTGREPDSLPAPRPDRYTAPPRLTHAGQFDRRNEDQHVVAVRELVREVERARLEVARRLACELNEMEAETRSLTEQKFHLHRAQKESQVLASDDPELRAKFAVLDDDLFGSFRRRRLRN